MAVDEGGDGGISEDIDGEFGTSGLIEGAHHCLEEGPEGILILYFSKFGFLSNLGFRFSDIGFRLSTGKEKGGVIIEDAGITGVKPRVIGGAQSKKAFCPFLPESMPSEPSSPGSSGRGIEESLLPTGILYFSAKYEGSTSKRSEIIVS